MTYRKKIGDHGEEFAAKILEDNGYKILDRNYWTKHGEIDIVACKDKCLHFVEVKTRTQLRYGYPAEAITEEKKSRMRRAANIYMSSSRVFWRNISFDVFEITTNVIPNCI